MKIIGNHIRTYDRHEMGGGGRGKLLNRLTSISFAIILIFFPPFQMKLQLKLKYLLTIRIHSINLKFFPSHEVLVCNVNPRAHKPLCFFP
jgi:hypothetical protein